MCVVFMSRRPGTQLLSEPTRTTAAIDPDALLARLGGVAPADFDVDLAALRLPRDLDERFWRDAAQRDSSTADRLRWRYARHLTPPLVVSTTLGRTRYGRPIWPLDVDTDGSVEPAALDDPAAGVWDVLIDLHERRSPNQYGASDGLVAGWNAIAPWHPELVAAHLMPLLAHAVANDNAGNPAPRSAAVLDAPTGTLGPVGHLGLVLALQGGSATTRTPAADTWFAAASDGRLDPALFGEAITLVHEAGELKLNRVVQTVAMTVADPVVAARTLLALTFAAPKLVEAKARHVHLLLDLAADLAARVGTHGVPPSLLADAPRGSSSLAVSRRRLASSRSMGPEGRDAAAGALEALLGRLQCARPGVAGGQRVSRSPAS